MKYTSLLHILVLTFLSSLVLAEPSSFQPHTSITITGKSFRINGELTYGGLNPEARGLLMNVRMVNSVFVDNNPETCPKGFDPDKNTDVFIASMDQYKSKGILAFTINLQGGMPGYEGAHNSAFYPDGSLKQDYMNRVARVIEAADQKGMVIIVGFFYQRQDQVLRDEEAVRKATVNASSWLKDRGYTNVLVEIANEYKHSGFDHPIILEEDGEVELMSLVRSAAPSLLVSTAGMGNARFHKNLAEAADYILLHGNVSEPVEYPERIKSVTGYGKPVIFNEDWCFSDDSREIPDAVEKMKAAFKNGASWGVMNQKRNQAWPFNFTIGTPGEGENAREDFLLYQAMAEMLGISENARE
ncbi:MAG: cellulase family glycosylhydrolase [Acidobacteriota bacterium]